MRLYVVRHAEAEDVGPDGTDSSRRLTARGRARQREAALGLAALEVRPTHLLTSPVRRAEETAAIIGEGLGVRPERLEPLQTGGSPHEILRALRPYASAESLLLVGHEPTVSELVALVLTGSTNGCGVRFKKGACVALELASLAPPRGAVLRWMMTQRQQAQIR